MKVVISTQSSENYGMHDWDGQGECPQYWKFKGGETYVVPNLSLEQSVAYQKKYMDQIRELLEVDNDAFRERVIGMTILEDHVPVCDPWDHPYALRQVDGKWIAQRTIENNEYANLHNEVVRKIEEYELLKCGDRKNYTVQYEMQSGEILDGKQVIEYLSKKSPKM